MILNNRDKIHRVVMHVMSGGHLDSELMRNSPNHPQNKRPVRFYQEIAALKGILEGLEEEEEKDVAAMVAAAAAAEEESKDGSSSSLSSPSASSHAAAADAETSVEQSGDDYLESSSRDFYNN